MAAEEDALANFSTQKATLTKAKKVRRDHRSWFYSSKKTRLWKRAGRKDLTILPFPELQHHV